MTFDRSVHDGAAKMKMGWIYRQFVFIGFFTLLIPSDSNALYTDICRDVRLPSDAIPLGSPFAFTCPCSNCDDVVIEKYGSPSQRLSEHITRQKESITLNIILNSTETAGTYQCCQKHCSSASNVLKNRTIRVGAKPGPAQLDSCYAEGLEYLICTWHHDVTSPGNFPPRYWGYFANSHLKEPRYNQLKWMDGSYKDERPVFYAEIPGNVHQAYYVKLCARNTFGCTCDVFSLGTLHDIMKPKRPKNLRAVSKDPTEIALSWKTPEDLMYQIDPVVYRVDWHQANLDSLHSNVTVPNKTNMRLRGLQPYTLYTFEVYARPYSDQRKAITGFWGIASTVSDRTAPDVPQSAPGILAGMYHKVVCEQNADLPCITIYWRPILKSDWGAKKIEYSLSINETNQEQSIQSISNVASTESKFEYATKLSGSCLLVQLRGVNEKGYSDGTYLNIPHRSDYQPSHVDGATLNSSRQQVSWKGDDSLNYTVFYCKKGTTDDCMEGEDGTLNAIETHDKEKKVEIVLKEPVPHKYGVSASHFDKVSRQTISGGIVWLQDMRTEVRLGEVKTNIHKDYTVLGGVLGGILSIVLVVGAAAGCRKWRLLEKREANDVENLFAQSSIGDNDTRSLPSIPNDASDNESASLITGYCDQIDVSDGTNSFPTSPPSSVVGSGTTQSSTPAYVDQVKRAQTDSEVSDAVSVGGPEGQLGQYGQLDQSGGSNSGMTTSSTAQSGTSDNRYVVPNGATGQTEPVCYGEFEVSENTNSFGTIPPAAQSGGSGDNFIISDGAEGGTEMNGQVDGSDGSDSFLPTPPAGHATLPSGTAGCQARPTEAESETRDICSDVHGEAGDYGPVMLDEPAEKSCQDSGLSVASYDGYNGCTSVDWSLDSVQTQKQQLLEQENIELQLLRDGALVGGL